MQYGPQYGYGYAFPHPAPPDPPELPEGAARFPRWPAWYGPAALGTGLVVTLVALTIIGVIVAAAGGHPGHPSAAFTQVGTVIQDAIFVGAALLFAARTIRPRPWHFGLARGKLWSTLGWVALGIVAFFLIAGIYSQVVNTHDRQNVVKDLGAKDSDVALVAGALLVIVVAPVAEEFFFRGFFYRALRTRMGVFLAALLDGLLFGAIHYSNPRTLAVLPVLALLGFIFCLVYERTGTLFATIGMHAFNNFLAYGDSTKDWGVAGAVAGCVLLACVAVPRFLPSRTPALR